MTPTELRALADALSRQRQADEHGIYCAVPRQAVDAAIKYLRAQADAQPVPTAWRDPDTGELSRIGRVRWQPLYAHPAPAAPQAVPFVPHARCKTPDKCRRDGVCFDAWACSSGPAPQAEPIDPHMIVAEDRFPDVPAEQWVTCSQCDGDFDRECPICDGLGKVLATDGEQAEPKPTPASGDDLGVYKGMADSYRNDAEQAELKREPLTALRILEIEDEATRKWRDNGRIIEYAIVFARMIERAAYERAAQECLATAAELRRCADGCTDGRYDWKADGADDCADAIRALGRQ